MCAAHGSTIGPGPEGVARTGDFDPHLRRQSISAVGGAVEIRPQIRLVSWQPSCQSRAYARELRRGDLPLPVLPLRRGPAYRRHPRLPVLPVHRMRRNLDGSARQTPSTPSGTTSDGPLTRATARQHRIFVCRSVTDEVEPHRSLRHRKTLSVNGLHQISRVGLPVASLLRCRKNHASRR